MSDFVVVGGGIAGASAAYHLACAGAKVTVVDFRARGDATAAGAGIVPVSPPVSAAERESPLAPLFAAAFSHYDELVARLAEDGREDTEYAVVGGLVIGREGVDVELAPLGMAAKADAPSLVDGSDIEAMFPPLREHIEGIFFPGYARVDGHLLRDALLSATVQRGGRMLIGEAFVSFEGSQARVEFEGERLMADRIIVASGAWGLQPETSLNVHPQRGQILHLALPGSELGGWPVVLDEVNDCYLVPFSPNRVVAGSTFEDERGFDHRVTAEGQARLLDNALRLAPGLAEATLLETRVGFRPFSADGLPILGAAPGNDAVFIVNGLGRLGLTLGPYAGSLVAELALGGEPGVDLSAFDPGRFRE